MPSSAIASTTAPVDLLGGRAASRAPVRSGSHVLREQRQAVGPTRLAIHAAEHCRRVSTVALEAAVFYLDPRLRRPFDDKPHLDFAGVRRIWVELELTVQVPRQREPGGRLEGGDATGVALLTVLADLVPATADGRLEDEISHRRLANRVFPRPPAAEFG